MFSRRTLWAVLPALALTLLPMPARADEKAPEKKTLTPMLCTTWVRP